jgi:DnaJ-class molecular chaperone
MVDMKMQIIKLGIFLTGLLIVSISCLDERNSMGVGTHPGGWMDISSDQFHGSAVTASISGAENCQSCHGQNYSGGTSQISCYDSQCHISYPHAEGFADDSSPDFHSNYISKVINWDITTCKTCHGNQYNGMDVNGVISEEKNCLKCHQQKGGPEACSTCHGNSQNAAPPEDLSANTQNYFITVGAHQQHLTGTTHTSNMLDNCVVCHADVPVFSVSNHVNDNTEHAEITFNQLAKGFGMSNPTWDRESATCNNVYCHGAFSFPEHDNNFAYADSAIEGTYKAVVWNSVGSNQAACGTCHGLPPKGHIATELTQCVNCHANVVDENLNIINKALHINGLVN